MSDARILCMVPAELAHLASDIEKAGATPVIDLTAGDGPVPAGAWVRVRNHEDVPGTGPVILAKVAAPIEGRDTWLEITMPMPTPKGFAGVILRGSEVGGPCGARPSLDLLRDIPADQNVIVATETRPDTAAQAIAAGAQKILLSDVLLGLDEVELPAGLQAALERADKTTSHVVNGFRIQSSPLAPVLRRLLAGESFWDCIQGWFAADDPMTVAWPAGEGAALATELAHQAESLEGLIALYQQAMDRRHVGPTRLAPRGSSPNNEAIAIIGMGCRMPGANSVAEYWENIKTGKSSITEVPQKRWDPALYFSTDRDAPDMTYAKIGGFLTDFKFNPRRFRIPPNVAKAVDPVQQITLESVADALDDANHGPERDFDRNRVAVILGNSMGGELGDDYNLRVRYPAMRKALEEVPDFAAMPREVQARILEVFESNVKGELPPITEDSMPGELANVIAGRVANAFNLTGPNFTVDAACASSMAAIQTAVKGLQDGDYDLAITGGSDRSMGVATYAKFCKIGALSPDHSAPFDQSANGFVMGEGAGVLVLKRLRDALRDGDQVYALIRSLGASSDGKGKGITAPNPRGQRLALQRAYAQAGIDPAEVDLIECHGTSTVVGDKVEVESITDVIGEGRRGDRGPVRIGSVKSMIGHLKSAAGAASFIKMALALHHKTFPPSINFGTARDDVPFDRVPLQVQTKPEPWQANHPRIAGVSAFGFGGTNFHAVLEEFDPQRHQQIAVDPQPEPIVAPRPTSSVGLPQGIWGISADSTQGLVTKLQAGATEAFDPTSRIRVVATATTQEEKDEQVQRTLKVLEKGQNTDLLRARGIQYEDTPSDGKLAFLFTGQGSQYIDMAMDLADHYDVVRETFAEADAVMEKELGRPLTTFIRRNPDLDKDVQFDSLRATEISQPATLAVDVAILRLMASYGVYPDMVAGHSLGEYGAAVAAGIMDFKSALLAVSARGREMAGIKIEDPGRMVGIAKGVDTVQEVLAEIPGYVIAANKNCPTQTVIAGESDAIEFAVEAFRSRGMTVYPLPVSHAFHSKIVAPASVPLKKFLARMNMSAPKRPITTNVTSQYYPTGPDAKDQVVDILAKQVASPVEWMAQIERMYADGARVFVECGPKRALTGFTVSILKRRPHRALYTNHPKRGGVTSFHDALAGLLAMGFPVRPTPSTGVPDLFGTMGPRLATTQALRQASGKAGGEATPEVLRGITEIIAKATGYEVTDIQIDDDLEADLGIDTVKQAEIIATVRDRFRLDHDPDFRISDYRSLRDLANYAARRIGAMTVGPRQPRQVTPTAPKLTAPQTPLSQPAPVPVTPAAIDPGVLTALTQGALQGGLEGQDADAIAQAMLPAFQSLVGAVSAVVKQQQPAPAPVPGAAPVSEAGTSKTSAVSLVISGASIGLPGGKEVFSEDNFRSILAGENRITSLSDDELDRFLSKKIVRLQKDGRTGQGEFIEVANRDDVIHLAGRASHFDLTEDYGVPPELVTALDVTTQLAFGAGLEALRDAGIPLVRTWRETKTGARVSTGWGLPETWRSGTGVIFASAFPGLTRLVEQVQRSNRGEPFDRKFLFQILAMGHSQFAQYIGAQGPNTQVNAACASTTQAIALGEDWIKLGRADRVIVLGADDVTNEHMLEWVGAGFLSSGAATTQAKVEDAALPFDRRRHGMIMGMGAVGLILEKESDVAARGMVPVARLLASRIGNSAFHGSRLHPTHISDEVDALIEEATQAVGLNRAAFAKKAMFMSHETYTPAKGGSAAAEINSLRKAFGASAKDVVIANTKGFTGHPMGASIEDAVAIKALQYTTIPPVPNLKEPDPDLGDLTLSPGGTIPVQYAIRLAAGFGSQLALTVWEKVADQDERVGDPAVHQAWLRSLGEGGPVELVVEDRALHLQEQVTQPNAESKSPAPTPAPKQTAPSPSMGTDVLAGIMAVVAEKTGYGVEELDPEYELEADLGIDTVKQAEIFSVVREQYSIAADEDFKISDYPTITKLAGWVSAHSDAEPPIVEAPPVEVGAPPVAAPVTEPVASPPPSDATPPADVLPQLLAVISEKTGYDVEELDPEYELEADLGIDTVKQAEIFAEVRDAFNIPRDDDFKLANYPTIQSLAGWLAESTATQTPGPTEGAGPTEEALFEPEEEPPAQDEALFVPDEEPPAQDEHLFDTQEEQQESAPALSEGVLPRLLAIVSEKTGYGVDELDPDYELEADLGIDTVKQAEIFSQVRDAFDIPRDDDFKLADYPTINGLTAWLEEQLTPTMGALPGPRVEEEDEPVEDPPSWDTAPAMEDPVDVVEPSISMREPTPVAFGLPAGFRIRRPVLIDRPREIAGSLRGMGVRVLGEGPLANAIRSALEEQGAIDNEHPDAIIDCGLPVVDSFAVAQRLETHRPKTWMCLTRLSADPSWAGLDQQADAGARAGFAKALGREWEHTKAVVLDLDPQLDDKNAALLATQELSAPDDAVEVFRDGSRRRVVELKREPFPETGATLPDNPVIVLTGGTRGITAQVARAFARRGPCRLALWSRSMPGTEPLDEAAQKARIKAEIQADGKRGTPAEIEAQLRPLRTAEEARTTIEALKGLGAEVRFYQLNLSDSDAIAGLLDQVIADFGRIDGVVHGAGVERSRLIQDKDLDEFHLVFDGKARGGLALAEALPKDAWFVSMGSVAGRFGNAGQVDYSAANDAMARVCMSRAGSLHVDWTAWGDVGMAVRGGMERLLTDRGVELLPATAGSDLLVDMVCGGVTGEVVVAGRLGDLASKPSHSLLDSAELDGDGAIVQRSLSRGTDPWIYDHAVEGTPLLPGVIGLEMMVAAAQVARPGLKYVGAKEVVFKASVKIHRDDPVKVQVRAEPISATEVRCVLSSERVAKTGRVLQTDHFEGTIVMGELEAVVDPLPSMFFPDEAITRGAIYRRFFHGPAFQVLKDATGVAVQGLLVDCVVEHAFIASGLSSRPLILESAFQAAGLHRMAIEGAMALPAKVDQVQLLSTPSDGAELHVMVRCTGNTYDIDVDGPNGAVMRVRGFEMVDTGPLPPGDRIPEPQDGWPPAIVATVATASSDASAVSPQERAVIAARGTQRRQNDRLAGRIAAKSAVMQATGAEPRAFEIINEPSGRPMVRGLADPPDLSISHRDQQAVAVASHQGRLGIDLEWVEPRDEAFQQTWLTPMEQGWCAGDPLRIAQVWAAKEAVLKALGTGMALRPQEVEIHMVARHEAEVHLMGEAAMHLAQLGGQLVVRFDHRSGPVVALAVLAA